MRLKILLAKISLEKEIIILLQRYLIAVIIMKEEHMEGMVKQMEKLHTYKKICLKMIK